MAIVPITKVTSVKYLALNRVSGNGTAPEQLRIPDFLLEFYHDPKGYTDLVNGIVICDAKMDDGKTVITPNEGRTAAARLELIVTSPLIMGKPPAFSRDHSNDTCALFARQDRQDRLVYEPWNPHNGAVYGDGTNSAPVIDTHVAACYLGVNVTCFNGLVSDNALSKYKLTGALGVGRGTTYFSKVKHFEAFLLTELNEIKPRLRIMGKGRAMQVTLG